MARVKQFCYYKNVIYIYFSSKTCIYSILHILVHIYICFLFLQRLKRSFKGNLLDNYLHKIFALNIYASFSNFLNDENTHCNVMGKTSHWKTYFIRVPSENT